MPSDNILSQDEIDALLTGMDGGEVSTQAEAFETDGEATGYDFQSQDRIVRGSLPTLEMINERFARSLRIALFNLLRRTAELSVGSVEMLKYSEYVQTLFMPTSMNLVKVSPLRGTALFTFDPKLVYSLVDCFFGGTGQSDSNVEGRDFTATERRVIQIVLDKIFIDLREAWKAALPVEFSHVGTEVNPQFANIVSPSEVVVVSVIQIEIEGAGGGLHLAFPYSMLEPIRELLDTGLQGDSQERDTRWGLALRKEVETVEVELASQLTQAQIDLRKLLALKSGDVIPIEMPEVVTGSVGGVPVLKGKFGASGGNLAIKVTETLGTTSRALAPFEGVGNE